MSMHLPADLSPDAVPTPPDLAIPPCPHFGPCGGCQLQHLTYQSQLALKAARLHELLEPTGLTLPQLQTHPSPPLAYRNRIRLSLTKLDGQLRAGYIRGSAPANPDGWPILSQSHRERVGYRAEHDRPFNVASQTSTAGDFHVLPITQCPIAAPILWRTAEAFLALINASPAAWLANPKQAPQQTLDQLELFTTADESRLQLTLFLRTQAKAASPPLASTFNTLCTALQTAIPALTGAGITLLPLANADRSRRTEVTRPGPTFGAPGLNYRVAGIDFWVPRNAFFQVNRFLTPELLSLVTANRIGSLAWDLYAGVGLFARALTRAFAQVVAVEIAEPAATALAAPQKKPALPNLHAVKATTLDFLRAAVIQRERPDLIVLDPPRTGAGPEICALLARIAAPTLIYVSCSPPHLAADLIPLIASGYTLAELHLLDLFPQTSHIETIAVLKR